MENHNVTAKKESYLTENAQYLVTMDSIISCLTRCTRSTEPYFWTKSIVDKQEGSNVQIMHIFIDTFFSHFTARKKEPNIFTNHLNFLIAINAIITISRWTWNYAGRQTHLHELENLGQHSFCFGLFLTQKIVLNLKICLPNCRVKKQGWFSNWSTI